MAVVIIVGLARSGKDTAADYIAERFGYSKYNFSSVLAEMLEEKGITPTKRAMNELGDMVREEMGMDAVARFLDKKITKKDNLVLVGPRSAEEINYFKRKFPGLKTIKIVSGKDERFLRRSKDDPENENEFFERDRNDLRKKGFRKAIESADFSVNNFGSVKELCLELENVMKLVLAE